MKFASSKSAGDQIQIAVHSLHRPREASGLTEDSEQNLIENDKYYFWKQYVFLEFHIKSNLTNRRCGTQKAQEKQHGKTHMQSLLIQI